MRRIIRQHQIVADTVRYPDEEFVAGSLQVVPVSEFLAQGGAPSHAVLVGPTDEVDGLSRSLSDIELIVIQFPKPGEGRGFSQARMLRERLRYRGELRARGALKRDQLFFLARAGFDSFDLDPGEDLEASLAKLHSFSVAYQAASDEVVQVRLRGKG
jgi:uncharacterized protein (DUF934 family)